MVMENCIWSQRQGSFSVVREVCIWPEQEGKRRDRYLRGAYRIALVITIPHPLGRSSKLFFPPRNNEEGRYKRRAMRLGKGSGEKYLAEVFPKTPFFPTYV